ncbi:hypothetical protein D3C76_1405400 [compost metagenome]
MRVSQVNQPVPPPTRVVNREGADILGALFKTVKDDSLGYAKPSAFGGLLLQNLKVSMSELQVGKLCRKSRWIVLL